MATKYSAAIGAATLTDITGGGLAAGKGGTYLITLCNRSVDPRKIRIALTTGPDVTIADYIEWDVEMEPGGAFSRWPVLLDQGWKVFIHADATGVSATLNGLERV